MPTDPGGARRSAPNHRWTNLFARNSPARTPPRDPALRMLGRTPSRFRVGLCELTFPGTDVLSPSSAEQATAPKSRCAASRLTRRLLMFCTRCSAALSITPGATNHWSDGSDIRGRLPQRFPPRIVRSGRAPRRQHDTDEMKRVPSGSISIMFLADQPMPCPAAPSSRSGTGCLPATSTARLSRPC